VMLDPAGYPLGLAWCQTATLATRLPTIGRLPEAVDESCLVDGHFYGEDMSPSQLPGRGHDRPHRGPAGCQGPCGQPLVPTGTHNPFKFFELDHLPEPRYRIEP
jgi:hypothetical protein